MAASGGAKTCVGWHCLGAQEGSRLGAFPSSLFRGTCPLVILPSPPETDTSVYVLKYLLTPAGHWERKASSQFGEEARSPLVKMLLQHGEMRGSAPKEQLTEGAHRSLPGRLTGTLRP